MNNNFLGELISKMYWKGFGGDATGNYVVCPVCDGQSWYADHAYECYGGNNCAWLNCPIQVQCADCEGTGTIKNSW